MKKLISLLCILTLIVGVAAFSCVNAGAAVDAAKTAVDVESGDEVTYILTLGGVKMPIIGCDFSMYYDSSVFEVVSVADFNDKTSEDDWTPLINTQLNGEIRGNWSLYPKGVDFSKDRHFLTVNLKAKEKTTSELSYFIRYMYDDNVFNSNDKPQITDYKFTCDVLVNGKKVLENAQPQLNVDEPQKTGLFVNSVTGDSADADADIPGTVAKKTAGSNSAPKSQGNAADTDVNTKSGGNGSNNGGNNGSVENPAIGYNDGNPNAGGNSSAASSSAEAEQAAPPATTAEGYFIIATDAEGNVTATSDEPPKVNNADNDKKSGNKVILWVVLAVIVLGGGVAAAVFYLKKKKGTKPTEPNAVSADAPTAAIAGAQAAADGDAKTEILNEGEAKTELLNNDAEKTELLDGDEAKTEILDDGAEKTELADDKE